MERAAEARGAFLGAGNLDAVGLRWGGADLEEDRISAMVPQIAKCKKKWERTDRERMYLSVGPEHI